MRKKDGSNDELCHHHDKFVCGTYGRSLLGFAVMMVALGARLAEVTGPH